MALVIQVGEDEDLPNRPQEFPTCGSWPPVNAERSTAGVAAVASGVAAVMQDSNSDSWPPVNAEHSTAAVAAVIHDSNSDAMSDSNHTSVSQSVASSTALAGINLGSLTILLAMLLVLVSSATLGLAKYIFGVRKEIDRDILPERTHLLQPDQTQI